MCLMQRAEGSQPRARTTLSAFSYGCAFTLTQLALEGHLGPFKHGVKDRLVDAATLCILKVVHVHLVRKPDTLKRRVQNVILLLDTLQGQRSAASMQQFCRVGAELACLGNCCLTRVRRSSTVYDWYLLLGAIPNVSTA